MADTNQFEDTQNQTAQANFGDYQQRIHDLQSQGEEYVRANPTPSVLWALGAGFILQLMPIGAIIGALIRLALFAIRPAIFIYGLVSLYKHYQHSQEDAH